MKIVLLLAALSLSLQAQTPHSVTLTWADNSSNPPGTTYSAYRATGLCSGTPSYSKIGTGITVKTFVDSTVTPGNYCYVVTATANGMESANSNTAAAPVPSFPPTGLNLIIQELDVQILEDDEVVI